MVLKWTNYGPFVSLITLIWISAVYLIYAQLRNMNVDGNEMEIENLELRLRSVSAKLSALRVMYDKLYAKVQIYRSHTKQMEKECKVQETTVRKKNERLQSVNKQRDDDHGPSLEYENLRHRVFSNTKELWNYLSHELENVIADYNNSITRKRLGDILDQVEDRKSVLLADQQRMWAADGYAEWRKREASEVSALVQRRLRALQNPLNCTDAKTVVCYLDKPCGFGCQIHHVAYCLIYAYATKRTLLLNTEDWSYSSNGRSWDHIFQPLSVTCQKIEVQKKSGWRVDRDELIEYLPIIEALLQKPKFLPLTIPRDLAKRIMRFNGDPASWWVGQMVRYILRLRPEVSSNLTASIAKINCPKNTIGIHVRRTDKIDTEASLHYIEEYMYHVEKYWRIQDVIAGTKVPRRVSFSSDDYMLIKKAREIYPHVEFFGNPDHFTFDVTPLELLLVDLALLARSEYFVGTFSSQLGRLVYELMQSNRPDASDSVTSLDDIYYFGGQHVHKRLALFDHWSQRPNEISFKAGDSIQVEGNHWDGYGFGTVRRTQGVWPWYKTEDILETFPFPEYENVSLKEHSTDGHMSSLASDTDQALF